MSWAEEKTLEQFIEVNSYDPSKASVIGLFPRNLTLKSQSITGEETFTISGHGFIFTLTANASARTRYQAASGDYSKARTKIVADLDETTSISIGYVEADSNLVGMNTWKSNEMSGPTYNTNLLYVGQDVFSDGNLNTAELNGPIEFKNGFTLRIETNNYNPYGTDCTNSGTATYILVDNGGGRKRLKLKSKISPGGIFVKMFRNLFSDISWKGGM